MAHDKRFLMVRISIVSHHEIIKATMAMVVPPVLIAAWIKEYRNSETLVKLEDVVTRKFAAQVECHKNKRD